MESPQSSQDVKSITLVREGRRFYTYKPSSKKYMRYNGYSGQRRRNSVQLFRKVLHKMFTCRDQVFIPVKRSLTTTMKSIFPGQENSDTGTQCVIDQVLK